MEERIARLEQKIDKLTDAVITLAAVEEKINSVNKRVDMADDSIEKMWESHTNLAKKFYETIPEAQQTARIFWTITTIAIPATITIIFQVFS